MKEVDKLIGTLSEHIENIIQNDRECENEIAEKTKALAALVAARASVATDYSFKE